MKPASEQLFFLIQSLTKSEKRYFYQFAQRHVKGQRNNYLKLFEAISKQKSYDERALKKLFKKEKFVAYFPVAKRYLYQQITESLHQFHLAGSAKASARRNLDIVEILLEKKLYQQAQKLLERTKAKIKQYEFTSLMPDCLRLERLTWDRGFYNSADKDAPKIWKEAMKNSLETIFQETEFAFFNSMISRWHFQKVTLSQKEEQNEMHSLVKVFQDKSRPTLGSKIDFFRAMSTYNFMEARHAEAYIYNHKLLHLFEQNTILMERYPQKYLSILNNFLIDNQQLRKYQELETGLQKLKSLPTQKAFKRIPSISLKVFELSTLLELNSFIAQQLFEKALLELPAIEKGINTYKSKISKHYQLTFSYLIGLLYFENQQFNKCQIWLTDLLQDKSKNILEELFRFANLLYLLTHYELGHFELLRHLILSVKRKHSQMNQLFQTEVLLFRLLQDLSNSASRQEKRQHYKKFKQALEPLQSNPEERRVFNYFNWMRWVERHVGD